MDTINFSPTAKGAGNFFESTSYTYYQAQAELVDNSLDASAKNVNLVLKYSDESNDIITEIVVIDDGNGMDLNDLQQALVLFKSSKIIFNVFYYKSHLLSKL